MLETRRAADEIADAVGAKYRTQGYVMDGIIQGVSYGVEFGQFLAFTYLTGGASTALRGVSAAAKGADAARRALSAAEGLERTARAASNTVKAATPYFWARMGVDAQEAAQRAGLDDERAFMFGAAVGTANSFLERLQFAIRMKNPFLGEKVLGLLNKKADYTRAVMTQYMLDGAKNRAKNFGAEYLVENLQNAVQELGLLVAGELTGNEYKELEGVAEDLLGQARDLKYPYLPRAL